jgi:hypothetical protein
MITAKELEFLIQMATSAPVQSYAHAKQLDAFFHKMLGFHQALATGKATIEIVAPEATSNLADTRGGVVIPAGGAPQAVQAAAVAAAETE